jgi:hypothetical protein
MQHSHTGNENFKPLPIFVAALITAWDTSRRGAPMENQALSRAQRLEFGNLPSGQND